VPDRLRRLCVYTREAIAMEGGRPGCRNRPALLRGQHRRRLGQNRCGAVLIEPTILCGRRHRLSLRMLVARRRPFSRCGRSKRRDWVHRPARRCTSPIRTQVDPHQTPVGWSAPSQESSRGAARPRARSQPALLRCRDTPTMLWQHPGGAF
jgi:hypothetical protein